MPKYKHYEKEYVQLLNTPTKNTFLEFGTRGMFHDCIPN